MNLPPGFVLEEPEGIQLPPGFELEKPAPSTERTAKEAIKDVGAGVLTGLGGLLQFPGQLVKLVPGMARIGEAIETPGEWIHQAGESLKSEGLKAREALRSQAISDAEKDGILSQFGTAIVSTLKDPALIASFIAEQVPMMLGPAGAARLVAKLGMSGIEAAGAGLAGSALEAATAKAAQEVGKRATLAARGTEVAMQGADVGSDAYNQAYQTAINQGMPEPQARAEAVKAGRIAALGGAGISALSQKIPGAQAIEKRMAGVPGAGRAVSGLGEALGEAVEEGGGQIAQNLAMRGLTPEQPLLQGVGGAAGLGALGGGAFGAALGAKPHVEAPNPEQANLDILQAQEDLFRQQKLLGDLRERAEEEGKIRLDKTAIRDALDLLNAYTEKPNVARPVEPAGGEGAEVSLKPVEPPAAERPETTEPHGVVPPVADVGVPATGERTEPPSVKTEGKQHQVVGYPILEVPLKDLSLSKDVPQFKLDATSEGIVKPLSGTFDRRGVAPVQVWRRNDGKLEVISGRHRFDLAKRSGEETIPAQIHDESEGFDATKAAMLDAELNIRDNQGKVKDYVNYFKAAGIDRNAAKSRGLLDRETGERAFSVATEGSDALIAAVRADQVGDEAAFLIASNAPNDERLQAVGLRALLDNKSPKFAVNTMQAVKALAKESDTTVDMFGFDDSAMRQAQQMADIASKKQREIQARLSAITGAAKNPALAKAEGIDIKDPEAVTKRINELRKLRDSWNHFSTNPEHIAEIRKELESQPSLRRKHGPTQPVFEGAVSTAPAEEAQEKAVPPSTQDLIKKQEAHYEKAKEHFQSLLKKRLNMFGLKDVGVRVVTDMRDANGRYSNKLIELAHDVEDPIRELRHESIHALKHLGFFTPAQWSSLTNQANKKWVDTYLKNRDVNGNPLTEGSTSRYDAYLNLFKEQGNSAQQIQEAMAEEAIADAFGDFASKPPPGMLQAIITRLKNFFSAIKEALGGVPNPEMIFRKVEEGKLAPEVKEKKESPKVSLREGRIRQSPEWVADHVSEVLSPAEIRKALQHLRAAVAESYGKQSKLTKQYMDEVSDIADIGKKTGRYNFTGELKESFWIPAVESVAPEVYVNTKNPFDFENKGHVNAVLSQVRNQLKEFKKYKGVASALYREGIESGSPETITNKDVQDALKKRGFDAFYTKKPYGQKSLSVLDKEQIERGEQPRLSIRGSKEFNQWFGDSKVVNPDGTPKIMYHGTARDISRFLPKQANAIFLTDDIDVATEYSQQSATWMADHVEEFLTPAQIEKSLKAAKALLRKNGYKTNQIEALEADKDIYKTDEFREAVSTYMPSASNVMPLFVKAEKPFDFDNPEHVKAVLKESGKDIDPAQFNRTNNWTTVENPDIQNAIKDLGFDSFYVNENGRKNLAVYEPSQIKSATGNVGAYGQRPITEEEAEAVGMTQAEAEKAQKEGDIRLSLRSKVSHAALTRIFETTSAREQKGYVERITDAIGPKTRAKFRAAALNRYNRLGDYDRMILERMGGAEFLADATAESAALQSDLAAGVTAGALGVYDKVGGVPVYTKHYVVLKSIPGRNGVNKFVQVGGKFSDLQTAKATASNVDGVVKERGFTTISNFKNTIKGPIAIFAPLARYNDPEVYQAYQFWAGVKRGEKWMTNNQKQVVKERLFKPSDIQHAQELERKYPEFKQVQADWIKYNNQLVEYMLSTGILSKERADEYRKHGDYIPFYRQMEGEESVGPRIFQSISRVQAPKKLKGGKNPLGDFLENIVRNTQSAIQSGMKNVAARRAADIGMDVGTVEQIDQKDASPVNSFYVFENGEKVWYDSSDVLFVESIKSLGIPDIPFMGLLAAPANALRNLVTKDPGFMLANMMKDSLSAYMTSNVNMVPFAATIKNFADAVANKSPELRALQNAGVLGGYDYSRGLKSATKEFEKELREKAGKRTTAEKIMHPAKWLWEGLEKGTQASDAATRVEIYKKTLKETGNEAEALFRALEVMNFNRKGNNPIVRVATAAIPFLNARIQGLDVLYRAGMGKNTTQNAKQIQKAFWVRGMTMFALSSMYWALTHDDDDYKKQEQETKDLNWLFPSLGIRIPIPFEVGFLFKTIPERICATVFGDDTAKDFTDSMVRNLQSTLMVNPIPQIALPLYEAKTNFSFFTNRPIVGKGLEEIAPEFQIGPGTSRTAEATGKLLGLSPMLVDHVIRGYTGTIGAYASDLIDAMYDLTTDSPKASKRFEQLPVVKRFVVDPEARGNVTAFYDTKNAVDEATRTLSYLEKNDLKAYGEYYKDNIRMFAFKDYIQDMEKTMKEYRDMKTMIRSMPMDADQKRDALKSVGQMENALQSNIQLIREQMFKQS
jgi:Large polyvalent protein associated domain 38/ADP-Ribosyltransferase in polyvalent proteins